MGNGAQQSRQIMLVQVAASQEQGECGSVLVLENYKEMNNWERQGVIHEAARICLMFLRI